MPAPVLVYVFPVHNEEATLAPKTERIVAYLAQFPGSEIFLVENGSADASWDECRSLEREEPVPVRAFREPAAGIGYAYNRGLTEALARFGPSPDHWAVLTAADLPFGTSDVDAARELLADPGPTRMIMGSKAHPESRTIATLSRKVTTQVYRSGRRIVLGMRVGDSQGSMLIRLDLAAEIVDAVETRGFFYSTEFCHRVECAGDVIREVPIVVEPEVRPSTVRPIKHGSEMALQMWELRRKTGSARHKRK
jgi:glycosyltransferase involved in cell wall biosynthesis